MKSFYKEWLKKSDSENLEALSHQQRKTSSTSLITEPNLPLLRTSKPTTPEPQPSTSHQVISASPEPPIDQPSTSPTEIVYENNKLLLLVEKGTFQRQKRFRLQDHLFHIKVKLKDPNQPIPFLKDILEFLDKGLLHLMENIKKFYDPNDANIAFLTIFQRPMLTGLNSGMFDLCSL